MEGKISIDEFKKAEIRIGEIVAAEKVADADKLLKLSVQFGEEMRQIVSGIAAYFPEPSALVGIKCAFATNLEPRTIRGLESNGMILAASDESGAFTLLRANADFPTGIAVR